MNEFNDYNNSISKTEGEKNIYIDAKFTVGDAKKRKKRIKSLEVL